MSNVFNIAVLAKQLIGTRVIAQGSLNQHCGGPDSLADERGPLTALIRV